MLIWNTYLVITSVLMMTVAHMRANVKVFAMHSRAGSNCNTQLHNAATGVEMK